MKLIDLNEDMRRDLSGLLDKVIYSYDGIDYKIRFANHLQDDRENGVARGDTIKPNELSKVVRASIKKLLELYNINDVIEYSSTNKILIPFDTSLEKTILTGTGKRKKLPLYSALVVAIFKNPKNDKETFFKIITVLPLQTYRYATKTKYGVYIR